MFKTKGEENKNDENYYQSSITVKIHTNHDGVRCLGPSRLFYHGDLWSSLQAAEIKLFTLQVNS